MTLCSRDTGTIWRPNGSNAGVWVVSTVLLFLPLPVDHIHSMIAWSFKLPPTTGGNDSEIDSDLPDTSILDHSDPNVGKLSSP